ncbi:MAG: hypothetical protein AAFR07_05530 [Pseudomonadota bacterium]
MIDRQVLRNAAMRCGWKERANGVLCSHRNEVRLYLDSQIEGAAVRALALETWRVWRKKFRRDWERDSNPGSRDALTQKYSQIIQALEKDAREALRLMVADFEQSVF